jgi:PBP1b-binding outer membrane lipoprotein LpoB
MSIKNPYGIIVFILIFIVGCAGTPQKSSNFKRHSEAEQKVII